MKGAIAKLKERGLRERFGFEFPKNIANRNHPAREYIRENFDNPVVKKYGLVKAIDTYSAKENQIGFPKWLEYIELLEDKQCPDFWVYMMKIAGFSTEKWNEPGMSNEEFEQLTGIKIPA